MASSTNCVKAAQLQCWGLSESSFPYFVWWLLNYRFKISEKKLETGGMQLTLRFQWSRINSPSLSPGAEKFSLQIAPPLVSRNFLRKAPYITNSKLKIKKLSFTTAIRQRKCLEHVFGSFHPKTPKLYAVCLVYINRSIRTRKYHYITTGI